VYGLIVPHMDTVEQAKAAVIASRYPQAEGVADFEPVGERGWWYRLAPRYWGLGVQEYYDVADLWPLDPHGELFLMPIIEGVQGVRNLPAILREVKGISAIWAGPGDLSIELGTRGNMADPRVEEGLQQVLKTCQEFNVPCAAVASPRDVEKRIEQGFRIIISGPSRTDQVLTTGKQVAGR
jgi:4-hydroxy-2-oxoheptanedioate aldolase